MSVFLCVAKSKNVFLVHGNIGGSFSHSCHNKKLGGLLLFSQFRHPVRR